MSKLIDLTNKKFGYWIVISRAENNKNGTARWLCKCTACGTEKVVLGTHLRDGSSTNCGCIRKEKMRLASIKDETGKTYGFLFVNRMAYEEEKPRNDRYGVYWNCTCTNCGKENVIVFGDYLRNGDTKSCGCINSANELKISKMLNNLNLRYKQQYIFDNLTSTGRPCDKLRFDFGVWTENGIFYIIEYDGEQHFKKNGFKGSYERTHKNDLLKNAYCFDNNIPIIRIPYNKTYNEDDLKLNKTRFLLTKQNVKEYYNIGE